MLRPLGWLYGRLADSRNKLYDRGVLKSHSLGARTISIGNITTGGTGKTPLVAYVAKILAEAGDKVCILTRGYGRESSGRVLVSDGERVLVDAREGGDEPVELALKLLGKAIVVADADRVSAAAWAKEKFGITTFVLDDGFQHRRAKRDLDLVCIDATAPFGNEMLLPAGPLREPPENLSRAGAIVLTRANLTESVDAVVERLRRWNPHAAIFTSGTSITDLRRLNDSEFRAAADRSPTVDWSALRATGELSENDEVRVLAFCALGNPKGFFTQMQEVFDEEAMNDEFELSAIRKFPDHHRYIQSDVDSLQKQALDAKVHAFVTTAKDAVKLRGLRFTVPCFIVDIEISISDPDAFRDLVLSA